MFSCVVDVLGIEANDCEGEDRLEEAENEVEDDEWERRGRGACRRAGTGIEAFECHSIARLPCVLAEKSCSGRSRNERILGMHPMDVQRGRGLQEGGEGKLNGEEEMIIWSFC